MLSLTSVGTNLLVKPWAFLSSVSILRCFGGIAASRSFSTTSDGPPKRPKTSYMQFAQQQWPVVVRQYPDVKVVDLSRKIAQQWRELSPDEKKPFQDAAAVARNRYNAEIERYKAQLTPAESAAMKQERRVKMARRKAGRKRRELRNLGKPKRPKTAFFSFIAEKFADTQGTSMLAKTKTLLEDWKKMTDAQKQVYLQQAEDDKVRYQNEMTSWEEHMREIGREDLVRQMGSKAKKKAAPAKRSGKPSRIKTMKTKPTVERASSETSPATTVSKTVRRGRKAEE